MKITIDETLDFHELGKLEGKYAEIKTKEGIFVRDRLREVEDEFLDKGYWLISFMHDHMTMGLYKDDEIKEVSAGDDINNIRDEYYEFIFQHKNDADFEEELDGFFDSLSYDDWIFLIKYSNFYYGEMHELMEVAKEYGCYYNPFDE